MLLWIAMGRQQQGFPEQAARIVAAAEALREDVGSVLSREDADAYESCREALRRQLGEAVLRDLSREGRAMTYDKAVAYALVEAPAGTLPVSDTRCLARQEGER